MNRKRIDTVVEKAEAQVGYRARAQKVNQYGAALGFDGQAWAGSFLETVMREAGEFGQPSLVHTASALAEYVRLNRVYHNPKRGDIVFLTASTDGPFSQPHIGLVTDTEKWRTEGRFTTIEGQTSTGLARGPQEPDGVYERTRFNTDVLAFARPKYGERVTVEPGKVPTVHAADVQPGKTAKKVVPVQSALASAVGAVGMKRGTFDRVTVTALAAYQRKIGYGADRATGQADDVTLTRLASDTRYEFFRVNG